MLGDYRMYFGFWGLRGRVGGSHFEAMRPGASSLGCRAAGSATQNNFFAASGAPGSHELRKGGGALGTASGLAPPAAWHRQQPRPCAAPPRKCWTHTATEGGGPRTLGAARRPRHCHVVPAIVTVRRLRAAI